MSKHLALLRGINVGGHNKVPMADLRELFDTLGLAEAKSLLQSGNVVFEGTTRTALALERLLEAEFIKRFEFPIDFVVRNAAEWESIVAANPFPDEAESDPSHLVVVFLKHEPAPNKVKELQAASNGPEVIRAEGKQLYIVYPAGIGDSKLTNTLIEKKLAMRGTARNWNTVLKLAALTQQ